MRIDWATLFITTAAILILIPPAAANAGVIDPAAAGAAYKTECGACHFAYLPGLLPERSWRKLLSAAGLAQHFGENAELPEARRTEIVGFLVANAADRVPFSLAKKIVASLPSGQTPLRITDVPYIRRKHREIPAKRLEHPQVRGLSYCDACHRKADAGYFDDDGVDIPGYGRWKR